MGVTGLWQILHPCARPIKLETLNRKRLAVDASIWIYQFLKAVRDKEGNALRNSHVVGFFRRICKLLFFGIKPVFVFDGGAPVLKRQTVSDRKSRPQRAAEQEEEAVPDDALVYVDEIGMSQKERQQSRKFKKKDAYHLPDLDVSMAEMGGPNDPRVMSLEDLQAYARQFETGEDINVYDFSKIDYDSAFFVSLPASDRYNILNAARLRSRLRMGHSKEQLDDMFPDRMAFSKFQIERVTERNELTQRLMHLNESGDALFNGGGRVAGEKGREYVLVKNDGVEGGWALGVISDEGTKQETAIDLDKPAPVVKQDEEWEDEDEFEDVPIEGLNRLPKRPRAESPNDDPLLKQRRAFYKSRRTGGARKSKPRTESNSLFVPEEPSEDVQEEWEDVSGNAELYGEMLNEGNGEEAGEDDEDLRRAIAMSLEQNRPARGEEEPSPPPSAEDDDMVEVFQQTAAPEALPLPKGSGRAIANMVNKRAFDSAPDSREITSFGVPRLLSAENTVDMDDDDGDTLDLQAALAESRRTKRKASSPKRQPMPAPPAKPSATSIAKQAGFSGPLPFEKLDLGSSLLGKKKMQERTEEAAGGFINPDLAEKEQKKSAEPLPPWFSADVEEGLQKQKLLEKEDLEKARRLREQFRFDDRGDGGSIRKTAEVIDLDAEENNTSFQKREVIDLEADDSEQDGGQLFDPTIRMGDMADKVRVEPPSMENGDRPDARVAGSPGTHVEQPENGIAAASPTAEISPPALPLDTRMEDGNNEDVEQPLDWSESEDERDGERHKGQDDRQKKASLQEDQQASRSPSADFEDVAIPDNAKSPRPASVSDEEEHESTSGPVPASGLVHQESLPEGVELVEFDDFSDPEDEELLRHLATEAEEHARFASTLNNKSQAQNIADYETELKQLRNQQKKDRRDADEVTHIMISECQQLLRLFGLPYVTAPMEAEAQCAELVRLGLVDGIVTDDSDCFLFGGTRIYKNMFNQAKFVECYLTSDLEKEFDLTREKLISVAHLLGSDYTEGLPGVGPVTALEVISEFPTLQEFKDWWSGVQMNAIPKSADANNAFRKKFRKNATKLFLPPSFPDTRVDVAYREPEVDSNPEAFQWGVPDLDALRSFLMATIGWSQERTDEVLVPVIKDMNRRADEGTQSNITAFFEGGVGIGAAGAEKRSAAGGGDAFAPRKRMGEGSKRMGSALTRMAEKARKSRGGDAGVTRGEGVGDGGVVATGASQKKGGGKGTAKGRRKRQTRAARRSESEVEDEPEPEVLEDSS
ncbi:hypothetical protein BDY17DRAFT_122252 [Neohortaea acidophila]|uniref:PIN domain-like protein n=1 Tax=Neohortaea acidophila TaxID=245834 RepID=A0A6A6PVH3_9PEZI|nr:uncharacterized protein BDY17DRAFT_122252 [Neohortaea acidophila]KAF2484148.1 hypothetical protein BDY17DRAFT_122252 [Neohortaea acidophila]